MGLGVRNAKLHFFKVRFKGPFGLTHIAIGQKKSSFDFFVSHVLDHTVNVGAARRLAHAESQLMGRHIMDLRGEQMNLWKHPRLTIQDRPIDGAFDAVHAARDVHINVNPLPYRHSFVFFQTLLEQQGFQSQGATHDAPAIQNGNGGLGECVVDGFQVFVSALICKDYNQLRQQFVLINNTRPLPKTLIYELLPNVEGLPDRYSSRSFSAKVVDLLNFTPTSNLFGEIKQHTNPTGVLSDLAIQKFVMNSASDGALREFSSSTNFEMLAYELVNNYFGAVKKVFNDSWVDTIC